VGVNALRVRKLSVRGGMRGRGINVFSIHFWGRPAADAIQEQSGQRAVSALTSAPLGAWLREPGQQPLAS